MDFRAEIEKILNSNEQINDVDLQNYLTDIIAPNADKLPILYRFSPANEYSLKEWDSRVMKILTDELLVCFERTFDEVTYKQVGIIKKLNALINESNEIPLSPVLDETVSKQSNAIRNYEECFALSQKSIIQSFCKHIIKDRKTKLLALCEHLDSNQVMARITAVQMVEQIVKKDDFCYLATIDSETLVLPIAQKLNSADLTPENIYSSLITSVANRLQHIATIQQERDMRLKQIESEKEKYTEELSQTGFFKFSKKKELHAEIDRLAEEYKRITDEYTKQLEAFF